MFWAETLWKPYGYDPIRKKTSCLFKTVICDISETCENANELNFSHNAESVSSTPTSYDGKTSGKFKKSCDSGGEEDDPSQILSALTTKNSEIIIIGHLNINFIENKFNSLVSLVKDKLDIIMVSETKSDESFPETQFIMEGWQFTRGWTTNLCARHDSMQRNQIKKYT